MALVEPSKFNRDTTKDITTSVTTINESNNSAVASANNAKWDPDRIDWFAVYMGTNPDKLTNGSGWTPKPSPNVEASKSNPENLSAGEYLKKRAGAAEAERNLSKTTSVTDPTTGAVVGGGSSIVPPKPTVKPEVPTIDQTSAPTSPNAETIDFSQISDLFSNATTPLTQAGDLLGTSVNEISGQIGDFLSKNVVIDTLNTTAANIKREIADPIKSLMSNISTPGKIFITNPATGGIDAVAQFQDFGAEGMKVLESIDPSELTAMAQRMGENIPFTDGELEELKGKAFDAASGIAKAVPINTIKGVVNGVKDTVRAGLQVVDGVLGAVDQVVSTAVNTATGVVNEITAPLNDFMQENLKFINSIPSGWKALLYSFDDALPNITLPNGVPLKNLPESLVYNQLSKLDKNITNTLGIRDAFYCDQYGGYTDYYKMQNLYNLTLVGGSLNGMDCMVGNLMSNSRYSDSSKNALLRALPEIARNGHTSTINTIIEGFGNDTSSISNKDKILGSLLKTVGGSGRSNSDTNMSLAEVESLSTKMGVTIRGMFESNRISKDEIQWDRPDPNEDVIIWDAPSIDTMDTRVSNHFVGSEVTKLTKGTPINDYITWETDRYMMAP